MGKRTGAPSRRIGRRRRKPDLSAGRPQLFLLNLVPIAIEGERITLEVAIRDREESSLHAVGRRAQPKQNAGIAATSH